MGDFNRSVILDAVRRAPDGVSRTELVDATGLSAQTVTNITRWLLDEGLIEEAGRTISGPGKPRVTLRVVPRSRMAVGVHLDPTTLTVVLLDVAGEVVARRVARTPSGDPMQVVGAMHDAVGQVLSGIDRSLVAGIGVATPGPIDAERGTIIEPPKLHAWHRVPLRDELSARCGMPVSLEKDTTAAAAGELWTGPHTSDASFLFVYLGTGVGCALAIDAEVFSGVSGNVGEVGHIIVDPDGPACACGRRGCVEVVCTPQAIVERAERAGVFPDACDGADESAVDARLSELCRRAGSGDAAAERVLAEAAGHLSVLVSALTNMLDVHRVVLGGPFWSRLSEVYLRELPALLRAQSATRQVRELPVEATVVGDDVAAVGAACGVLDEALAPKAASLLLDS